MKIRPLAALTLVSATLLASMAPSHNAQAGTSTSFTCSVDNGVPTTMAQTQRGVTPVIRWSSDSFSDSGWTPEKRCTEVSKRFQTYSDEGTLSFLTTGVMNGMPVVCTTNQEGGTCQNLLFTLQSGDNAGQTLRNLLAVRNRASGPLNQSTARVYVDMAEYLLMAPVEPGTAPEDADLGESPEVSPTTSDAILW
jgi:hypothetical protein